MKYTQEYRIYENDVDFRKMATLGALLRYCQQIGAEDAEHYGITPELYASTHTSYVLAKLALHITRTPRVEETITVQTEPEALHRAVNRRFTTFCDAQRYPPATRPYTSGFQIDFKRCRAAFLRCTGQGRGVCGQPLGVD